MAEDVGAHPVARTVDFESPAEQPHRVGAVHREEAAPVVGDLAERARLDQLLGVLHQRRPAVVVANTGDDTINYSWGVIEPDGDSLVFSLIYNENYIIYLLYYIIFVLLILSLIVIFILPTPNEQKIIEQITNEIFEQANIQVTKQMGACSSIRILLFF